ncbi:hypothetical protein [Oceanobacillus polygoni]|uniref:Glucan phosphoethanolaminetransferase (Alkaline phosphatase superfamily) n=1 Tax=Oceanobacillus polygoni TaxID=1235259 RepID=A0A9X0YQG6_9BACI|nr:hypothetical protein [Oceanobacillus polygoni]MBP2077040.1 glucan phosphoethanolaminetransferase (alkaline phosphatase superfamily) [Oceanobacillus polygoni]
MLICPKCNFQQESGKFCGACGEQVIESDEGQTQSPQQEVRAGFEQAATATAIQPSASAIKSGVSHYWSYFLNLLKNPTHAFASTEKHFVSGLITLGLFAIIYAFSLYFLASTIARSLGGFFSVTIPFFDLTSRLIFGVILSFAITFGSAFAMTKLAKNQESFKTLLTQYGSIIVPFTALNVVAMLGGIIGSIELTIVPLILSMIFAFVFIPVLFVYEKASKVNPNGQKIYLSLATVVLITIISYILGELLFSSIIEDVERILYRVL